MSYWIFLTLCIIATATPGPAVFLAIRNGAFYGFRKSLLGILGNISAMFTMASISAAGLGTLLLSSSYLFFIIKILGGFYLIYLGIKAIRSNSFINRQNDIFQNKKGIELFKEAYFVGVSNPKAIVFYTALFPQFLDLEKSIFGQFLVLSGTFLFFSFLFLSLYSALASNIKVYLLKQEVIKWFNRVLGSLFIGFGVAITTSQR
ncbi:LysE family translocator [Halarcobacter ebronensis]|uniref:Threonine transporter n=1 Tax=Halarcobacter ebronensis TaxID=1462615 RepID=A0A4Q1AM20_9BACT|nr:LysE family translocator [Halarcobacter ebronensis]QKF81733.1 transporter, LysE family [Halarcobacter ebronensis]RXK04589.1 threonine transporter [Halarcobacter ebronensis]